MKKLIVTLTELGINHQAVDEQYSKKIGRDWLETFATNVKRNTGSWILNGFRWHGFSFGYENSTSGSIALNQYLSQWISPYFVSGEDFEKIYLCTTEIYPDFSKEKSDIYVFHKNLKWSITFTHEPDLGPYFAERVKQKNSDLRTQSK